MYRSKTSRLRITFKNVGLKKRVREREKERSWLKGERVGEG